MCVRVCAHVCMSAASSFFLNLSSNYVYFEMMQKGDDLGKFRLLDEIMLIDGYPGYQHLLSIAENSMQLVCEVKGDLLPIGFLLKSFLLY